MRPGPLQTVVRRSLTWVDEHFENLCNRSPHTHPGAVNGIGLQFHPYGPLGFARMAPCIYPAWVRPD